MVAAVVCSYFIICSFFLADDAMRLFLKPSSITLHDVSILSSYNHINDFNAELKLLFNASNRLGLDINLKAINETIAAWMKPLPSDYFSKPLVVVGPSGVGKNRLIRSLLRDYQKFFEKVVTHTTRLPRNIEINESDYVFVTKETFLLKQKNNDFLEHATVHNNLYGISTLLWNNTKIKQKIPILEIDIQGAKTINKISLELNITPNFIFIAPQNISTLEKRLKYRNTETNEEIDLRLLNAKKELLEYESTNFFNKTIVNYNIDESITLLFRYIKYWFIIFKIIYYFDYNINNYYHDFILVFYYKY
jgi:guanylate kinase